MNIDMSVKRTISGSCRLLLVVLATLVFQTAAVLAAPMDGYESSFTQPDGTVIPLKFYGDEYYARTETEDGYTVIFDDATKSYHYAALSPDGNEFVSTGAQVGKTAPATLGLA